MQKMVNVTGNEPVRLVNFRNEWESSFLAEKSSLAKVFATSPIVHIGSTAVSGLLSKPIVDIMVGIADFDAHSSYYRQLRELGYEYKPSFEEICSGCRFFLKKTAGTISHQLHITPHNSLYWQDKLLFRNYLRKYRSVREAYAKLKEDLAEEFGSKREQYTAGKSEFIKKTVADAYDELFMGAALIQAKKAAEENEIPIGAVLVKEKKIVVAAANYTKINPLAHAEKIILDKIQQNGKIFLYEYTLYVTVEPCSMCSGMIVWSRVGRLVFGTYDEKAGACGSVYHLLREKAFNHHPQVKQGVLQEKCMALMRNFFSEKR